MLYRLSTFAFVAYALGVISKKSLPKLTSYSCPPMFPSNNFTVSGIVFQSLIYFELFCVCGLRSISNFIVFHLSIQWFSTPSFPIVYSWQSCPRSVDYMCVCVHSQAFWALYSVLVVYISACQHHTVFSVHFRVKSFNITVIQVYTPTTNAREGEGEWFSDDLQDILKLTAKKVPFSS